MRVETWVVWLVACLSIGLSTRNPMYLGLLLLIVAVVMGKAWPVGRALRLLPIVLIAAAFNFFTVHIGDTVLFTLPPQLPLIGGALTLEALVYGALNGLALAAVIALFDAFMRVVEPYDLIRVTPRAFQSVGVTVGIAMNFVPQTARRYDEVREAMAMRGLRPRGLRGWLPLWVPMLAGGLDNASRIADAMLARGFVDDRPTAHNRGARWLVAAGLGLVLAGWLARLADFSSDVGSLVMALGVFAVLVAFWLAGRGNDTTRYHATKFGWRDAASIGACACVLLIFFAPAPALGPAQATLNYSPYPQLSWPTFSPLLGLAMLLLLAPALRRR